MQSNASDKNECCLKYVYWEAIRQVPQLRCTSISCLWACVDSSDSSYIRTWEGRMEPESSLIFSQMSVDSDELATYEWAKRSSSRVNRIARYTQPPEGRILNRNINILLSSVLCCLTYELVVLLTRITFETLELLCI